MKKVYISPFILIMVAIIFISCEKTIEFKSGEIKSKIVVNAVFYAGSKYKYVKVEKSKSILNDNNYFEALPNASVQLFENGVFVSELHYISVIDTFYDHLNYGVIRKIPYEHGTFLDSNIVVQPGSTYRLEITHEGIDPVYCETTVPFPVKLGEMSVTKEKKPKQYAENNFRFKLRLPVYDFKNEKNYYQLRVGREQGYEAALNNFGGYYYGGPGSVYYGGGYNGGGHGNSSYIDIDSVVPTDTILQEISYNLMIFSYDPVLSPDGNTDVLTTENGAVDFFTDELINPGKHDLSFWFETRRDVYTELGEYLELQGFIMHLSPELYFYSVSRQSQSLARDNPFAEPVPVFSNITGGMGIFGSVATSKQSAQIGDFPIPGKTYINKDEYFRQYYSY